MVIHPKISCYTLSWSADWTALFGAERPLIVEIGFGNGAYLLELAKQNPDCNVIGLEIASQSLEKTEAKIAKSGLTNVRAIFSKAETALYHLFEPNSVREFHVNYPDPWFKDRHARRRLIQRDTLDSIVNRLQIGGKFYLATDIVAYAEMSHELLQATPQLTNLLDAPWVNTFPQRLITTKYEAKGYEEGRIGNYFWYERNATPALDIPVMKELEMPHMVISTPMPASEIVARAEKQTHNPTEGIYIMFRDAFLHQNNRAMMFEVSIEEPTIDQHIAIMLFPRDEPHAYTVKYTTLGQPRMTAGLHHATALLADWVVSLHPEAKVLARKVGI
jgi:tRNA (guanine-N7-)-methyltransferase